MMSRGFINYLKLIYFTDYVELIVFYIILQFNIKINRVQHNMKVLNNTWSLIGWQDFYSFDLSLGVCGKLAPFAEGKLTFECGEFDLFHLDSLCGKLRFESSEYF